MLLVLETQLDDATGQAVAHAAARLLEAGALDVYTVPIVMKKGRPGQLLTVLCRAADGAALEDLLFAETTTFGIRRHECARRMLAREHATVQTPYGPIRVKVGRRGAEVVQGVARIRGLCPGGARAGRGAADGAGGGAAGLDGATRGPAAGRGKCANDGSER